MGECETSRGFVGGPGCTIQKKSPSVGRPRGKGPTPTGEESGLREKDRLLERWVSRRPRGENARLMCRRGSKNDKNSALRQKKRKGDQQKQRLGPWKKPPTKTAFEKEKEFPRGEARGQRGKKKKRTQGKVYLPMAPEGENFRKKREKKGDGHQPGTRKKFCTTKGEENVLGASRTGGSGNPGT